ncbi:MAG: efflux RND transporter periplasmic adaptor subunit [Rubrivivax sp.]
MPRKRWWVLGGVLLLGVGVAVTAARWRGPELAVVVARNAPLVQTVVFSARVASPTRVFVGSTLTGRVAEVPQREGALLARDQLVVRLDDAELSAAARQADAALAAAQARLASQRALAAPVATQQLAQARANAQAAERERERSEALFKQEFIGQARLDEARRAAEVAQAQVRAAEAQAQANSTGAELVQAEARVAEARAAAELARSRLAQTRIVAPEAALLLQRLVEPGQIVQPGTRLAELALRQAPELVAQVDEKFLGQLSLGQAASVVADAYPQQPFAARVARIAPLVDAQRGSVEVKLELPQPPAFLRDDLTVSVEVVTGRREQALVVPAEALRAGSSVLVLHDGVVAERRVRTGLRSLVSVEVTEGLREGDAVVLDGAAVPGQRARPGAPRPRNGNGNGDSGGGAAAAVQSMGR